MSIESAKALIEKVQNDGDFKAKLSSFTDAQEKMNFVKAEGFDFTVEELQQVSGEELSEDELDAISGGAKICKKVCAPYVGGMTKEIEAEL